MLYDTTRLPLGLHCNCRRRKCSVPGPTKMLDKHRAVLVEESLDHSFPLSPAAEPHAPCTPRVRTRTYPYLNHNHRHVHGRARVVCTRTFCTTAGGHSPAEAAGLCAARPVPGAHGGPAFQDQDRGGLRPRPPRRHGQLRSRRRHGGTRVSCLCFIVLVSRSLSLCACWAGLGETSFAAESRTSQCSSFALRTEGQTLLLQLLFLFVGLSGRFIPAIAYTVLSVLLFGLVFLLERVHDYGSSTDDGVFAPNP